VGFGIRDNCSGVHFGAGSGQRHNRSKVDTIGSISFLNEFSGIAIIIDAGGDEFSSIKHGATADSEYEVNVVLFTEGNCFAERVNFGIWLDASKFNIFMIGKGINNLIIDVILFNATTSEGKQKFFIEGDEFSQLCDLVFTKDEFSWIAEDEVIHKIFVFLN